MMKAIEKELLKSAAKHDGCYIHNVIESFLKEHNESKLRRCITNLALDGFIKLDRRRGHNRVFVTVTDDGRKSLQDIGFCHKEA